MHVTAIIAAGGSGSRLRADGPKQFLDLGGRPILAHSVRALADHPRISELIVALPARTAAAPPAWLSSLAKVRIVAGGPRRQDSVANAFEAITGAEVVLIHDAARPFVSADLISRSIDAALTFGAAIVATPVSDTVKQVTMGTGGPVIRGTLPRDSIYLAQTPQAFRTGVLQTAVALGRSGTEATDEASLAEQAGHTVHVVSGEAGNVKITTASDLAQARARLVSAGTSRAGTGYDLHRLVAGRPLIIGGVHIPFEKGALGHSDADVACHAVTDAVLGAACLGDIGRHFPDSEAKWKGASSIDLLRQAAALVREAGHDVVNVDVVVVLERPTIAPLVEAMREGLASALGIPVERVSVKGKTNEGVDAVGRGEAIAAHAVALLRTW
jgi:2-C-methyl-D-erythritol 4-phosphate cytidylyltransferase/2-C-methyl-D-erythritol 2,4-cyclodiphosphate synthase